MPETEPHIATRILIVGAGAVGQVYGRALAHGGARVSVLVRPQRSAVANAGYTLHLRPLTNRTRRSHWLPAEVLTSLSEVARRSWQQVWLCVPSDRLREAWLPDLLAVIGQATVVSQHPVPEDRQVLLRTVDVDRLVEGTISFLSWSVDLQGDGLGSDTRVFVPPLADHFSGPLVRAREVVCALRAGGWRARLIADAGTRYRVMGALSLPLMASLELAGWSLRDLARGRKIGLGCRAGREALTLRSERLTLKDRLVRFLWRATLLRPLLHLARWLAPLPLEAFLKYHFTKVAAQTRLLLVENLRRASARGEPAPAIEQLASELGVKR